MPLLQERRRPRAARSTGVLARAFGAPRAEGHGQEAQIPATQILRQLPRRDAALSEARLLADAVNLDDFGVVGLFLQAMHLARQHAGIAQLIEGYDKRREYGYWEARLKDGFHFDAVREMARKRMASAQRAVELLKAELSQDEQPPD
jgi:hypothetical protein